jgi:exodeoxyribonuclease VII large subunit
MRAERARVARSADALRRREPREMLRDLRRRREAARGRLVAWSAATFRRESLRLAGLSARLEPANVAKILSRGFALALRDGRPLLRSAEASPGEPLRVALGEGWLDARVESRDVPPDPIPGRAPRPDEA